MKQWRPVTEPPVRPLDSRAGLAWSVPLILFNGEFMMTGQYHVCGNNPDDLSASYDYDNDEYSMAYPEATHWMPLPEPPAS